MIRDPILAYIFSPQSLLGLVVCGLGFAWLYMLTNTLLKRLYWSWHDFGYLIYLTAIGAGAVWLRYQVG